MRGLVEKPMLGLNVLAWHQWAVFDGRTRFTSDGREVRVFGSNDEPGCLSRSHGGMRFRRVLTFRNDEIDYVAGCLGTIHPECL